MTSAFAQAAAAGWPGLSGEGSKPPSSSTSRAHSGLPDALVEPQMGSQKSMSRQSSAGLFGRRPSAAQPELWRASRVRTDPSRQQASPAVPTHSMPHPRPACSTCCHSRPRRPRPDRRRWSSAPSRWACRACGTSVAPPSSTPAACASPRRWERARLRVRASRDMCGVRTLARAAGNGLASTLLVAGAHGPAALCVALRVALRAACTAPVALLRACSHSLRPAQQLMHTQWWSSRS